MHYGMASRTAYWNTDKGVDFGLRDVMSLRSWESIFSKWTMPAFEPGTGLVDVEPPPGPSLGATDPPTHPPEIPS